MCSSDLIATRERVTGELRTLGFTVFPSLTNFFLMGHPRLDAKEIQSYLRERGILVRYFSSPRIDRYLRVTVGTDEEMDRLLEALGQLVQSRGYQP